MQYVKAIIGACFGNEGKGKVTNYHAKNWADIVVRFNGSCQSTHTVAYKNGFKHIYGHLGSSSIDNIPTYLSQYFVVNPFSYINELDILSFRSKGMPISTVYVDENCFISLPFDGIINKILELSRKEARHGSSGIGMHETILRNGDFNYKLTVKDAQNFIMSDLVLRIKTIRDWYVLPRIKKLNLEIPSNYKHLFTDDAIKYIVDCIYMFLEYVQVTNVHILHNFNNVVFEGAQGLLLDEDAIEWHPHVTHSKTGVQNILRIMNSLGALNSIISQDAMEVIYVTRSYVTRHGKGRFPSENNNMKDFDIIDDSNKPGEFKGVLRTGYLDVSLIREAIAIDSMLLSNRVFKRIHMTCMDHFIGDPYLFPYKLESNVTHHCDIKSIPALFAKVVHGFETSNSPFSD